MKGLITLRTQDNTDICPNVTLEWIIRKTYVYAYGIITQGSLTWGSEYCLSRAGHCPSDLSDRIRQTVFHYVNPFNLASPELIWITNF